MAMTKKRLSTYERLMQDEAFKVAYEKEYKEFILSELLLAMMEEDAPSVRKLAKEAGLSATVIQNLRSGRQKDIKLNSFRSIARACGYHIVLEKEGERIPIA